MPCLLQLVNSETRFKDNAIWVSYLREKQDDLQSTPTLERWSWTREAEKRLAAAAQTQTRPSSSNRPLPPPHPLQPRSPPQPPLLAPPRFEPVDREKTCPLLLQVFTKSFGHRKRAIAPGKLPACSLIKFSDC
ncbi:hypothetical protein I3842_11G141900 [Carya illinoinensis]|uniref:Uncharacterized protein n=1 Tax=Carya illinoinensis TaxID=32201 RepID=A0A922J050_CARIL|nr:hypothetical protein I3842_11G141900 [Carya illinoinensis]